MDSPGAIAILNNWSTSSVAAGDVKRALALFDEVIRLASQRVSGGKPPPYAASNRAAALLALGRYREAIEQADRAFVIAQEANHRAFQTSALLTKAGAYTELGELQAADRLLAEATTLARDLLADSAIKIIVSLRRAKLALAKGEPEVAHDAIEPAIELFEGRRMRVAPLALALLLRAEGRNRLGDRAAALRDAQDALQITQQIQGGRPYSLLTGQSWLLLARLKRDDGDAAASRAAARNAAEHLTDMLGETHRDTLLARQLASE